MAGAVDIQAKAYHRSISIGQGASIWQPRQALALLQTVRKPWVTKMVWVPDEVESREAYGRKEA